MTKMKKILISLSVILCATAWTNADLAGPPNNGKPMKFTIYGHTGQDPAPKRDESTWGGPSWPSLQIEKDPLPTKEILFSIMYEEKLEIKYHFADEVPALSFKTDISQERFDNSSIHTPENGAIPAPAATILLVFGLLKKRRRA
jgi:hypothetical protein